MLITIERRTSCSMFARSCKHPITELIVWDGHKVVSHLSQTGPNCVWCYPVLCRGTLHSDWGGAETDGHDK